VIFGVTALATASFGVTGTTQVRGTLAEKVHLNADRLKFQTKDDTDVVVQTFTYIPGGYSGWHTHPGFVLVVVESGTVTIQVGCSVHSYSAGQSFVESGTDPIMARNLSGAPLVVRATYVVPKGVAVRREVLTAPVCS
jgi:hypothetical protein